MSSYTSPHRKLFGKGQRKRKIRLPLGSMGVSNEVRFEAENSVMLFQDDPIKLEAKWR